jgi:hypothetical protein
MLRQSAALLVGAYVQLLGGTPHQLFQMRIGERNDAKSPTTGLFELAIGAGPVAEHAGRSSFFADLS